MCFDVSGVIVGSRFIGIENIVLQLGEKSLEDSLKGTLLFVALSLFVSLCVSLSHSLQSPCISCGPLCVYFLSVGRGEIVCSQFIGIENMVLQLSEKKFGGLLCLFFERHIAICSTLSLCVSLCFFVSLYLFISSVSTCVFSVSWSGLWSFFRTFVATLD